MAPLEGTRGSGREGRGRGEDGWTRRCPWAEVRRHWCVIKPEGCLCLCAEPFCFDLVFGREGSTACCAIECGGRSCAALIRSMYDTEIPELAYSCIETRELTWYTLGIMNFRTPVTCYGSLVLLGLRVWRHPELVRIPRGLEAPSSQCQTSEGLASYMDDDLTPTRFVLQRQVSPPALDSSYNNVFKS